MITPFRQKVRRVVRRSLLRMASSLEPTRESFFTGFDGVPDSDTRSVMSPHELAQYVVEAARTKGKDSVAFILLSFELQLKLAKEQSTAAYRAAVLSLFGIALGAFLQNLMQQPNNCAAREAERIFNSKTPDVTQNRPIPTTNSARPLGAKP